MSAKPKFSPEVISLAQELPSWFNFLAQDADGAWYAYVSVPDISQYCPHWITPDDDDTYMIPPKYAPPRVEFWKYSLIDLGEVKKHITKEQLRS